MGDLDCAMTPAGLPTEPPRSFQAALSGPGPPVTVHLPAAAPAAAQLPRNAPMPGLFSRLVMLALLPLPMLAGCSTLMTVAYLIQPADMPAEFDGLKGKTVAVVCRPIIELEFTDAGSARELASLVGMQIEQKVR